MPRCPAANNTLDPCLASSSPLTHLSSAQLQPTRNHGHVTSTLGTGWRASERMQRYGHGLGILPFAYHLLNVICLEDCLRRIAARLCLLEAADRYHGDSLNGSGNVKVDGRCKPPTEAKDDCADACCKPPTEAKDDCADACCKPPTEAKDDCCKPPSENNDSCANKKMELIHRMHSPKDLLPVMNICRSRLHVSNLSFARDSVYAAA